jgi:hypothetical protein
MESIAFIVFAAASFLYAARFEVLAPENDVIKERRQFISRRPRKWRTEDCSSGEDKEVSAGNHDCSPPFPIRS